MKNGLNNNRLHPNKVEDSEHVIMIWYQETLGVIDSTTNINIWYDEYDYVMQMYHLKPDLNA